MGFCYVGYVIGWVDIQMSTTQETYEHLTEIHGISREVCKHCYNRDIEIYQDNWESCYCCWCKLCEPIIEWVE